MSDPYGSNTSSMRTLAVRMSEDERAQLDILADLNDRAVTDEVRTAIDAWIERSKSDPKILALADHAREQIERGQLRERLERTTADLVRGAQTIPSYVELLAAPQRSYDGSPDSVKRQLLETFYLELHIDMSDRINVEGIRTPSVESYARALKLSASRRSRNKIKSPSFDRGL